MASVKPLSQEEQQIIEKLRWLRAHHANFKLTIFGQGSLKRNILDMEWAPRVRLSQQEFSQAIDD